MADEICKIESRLTSLRARRQRWLDRFAAAENVPGQADERARCKENLKLVDELIAAAEKNLYAAQRKAVVAENEAILKEESAMTNNNSDFSYFPPTAGMVLRCNSTLRMEAVAKELGLPNAMIRRGTYLVGKAAEIFMASRNAEKMLETRMVRYVRSPG
jgi:hypothetical protein